MGTFTRIEIEEGLKRLGELAQAKGFHIQLTLVGGAVMVLRFNARPSTRDTLTQLFFNLAKRVWLGNLPGESPMNSNGQKIG